MINTIKENAFLCFTLSLIASYFGVCGYYLQFNFDITSFLSIEDLILIFARHVWLICTAIFVLWSIWARINEQIKNRERPFTIKQKRLILGIVIIFMIAVNYLLSKSLNFESFLLVSIGGALFILTLYGIITFAILFLEGASSISQISMRGWFYIVATLYFFIILIPIGCGMAMAKYTNYDEIVMEFDDNSTVNTSNTKELKYIGKVSSYIFVYKEKENRVTAYPMEKVKKISLKPKSSFVFLN